MERYIVELENNHHYILIDTVTGETFYTPAKEDANRLAFLLNNRKNKSPNLSMKCENCGYLYFNTLKEDYYCSMKDTRIPNLEDKCNDWER